MARRHRARGAQVMETPHRVPTLSASVSSGLEGPMERRCVCVFSLRKFIGGMDSHLGALFEVTHSQHDLLWIGALKASAGCCS
jgi:hypothetical protein